MSVRKPTRVKVLRPCASCPFHFTNFKEFGAVAKKLCAKHRQPEPDFWAVESIRKNIRSDAIRSGALLCHSQVYDLEMSAHPEQAGPCAGLALFLKKSKRQRRGEAA